MNDQRDLIDMLKEEAKTSKTFEHNVLRILRDPDYDLNRIHIEYGNLKDKGDVKTVGECYLQGVFGIFLFSFRAEQYQDTVRKSMLEHVKSQEDDHKEHQTIETIGNLFTFIKQIFRRARRQDSKRSAEVCVDIDETEARRREAETI